MSSLCEIKNELYDQVILQSYSPSQITRVKDKATRNRNQHNIVFVGFTKTIASNNQRHCPTDLVDTLHRQNKQIAMVMS
ncbi:hypothetical protein B5D82_14205 [Cognaticolwellia beringensis]|uniref:Uncharacterized protein n=1 Tax=Cognaticolwellia beringensis TaxID=1967665 RepID=A0A222GA87_9GAMM|nr:hypothetical protein B5D82_14205 [Cognaticolwellia beringensis]